MNKTENFSSKFNTDQPIFLYDDTRRNASFIVTKILAVSDKNMFVEAIYINPEYREEPLEFLINKDSTVVGGEEYLFYLASNDSEFFAREFADSDGDEIEPPYEAFAPEIALLHQITA